LPCVDLDRGFPPHCLLGGIRSQLASRDLRGKTTVVFYEDKDSTDQNKALKAALKHQKKTYGRGPNVRLVAVADVSAWNFWPAKGYVQDAVRDQERKAGHPIYLDWSGSFGKGPPIRRTSQRRPSMRPGARAPRREGEGILEVFRA